MKKNFKKVLSLALAFAMSFATFAPTMVKAEPESAYGKVDCVKVTNHLGDTATIDAAPNNFRLRVLVKKDVPAGQNNTFKYWKQDETQDEAPVAVLEARLKANSAAMNGESFKRFNLVDDSDKELKLPVGDYTIEVQEVINGGKFKIQGTNVNTLTKIEVYEEQNSNANTVVKSRMKTGVQDIRLFEELTVQASKLLKLVFRETANNQAGAPIVNALVKIKLGNAWIDTYSNEKGEIQLLWKDEVPTEAKIINAAGYLFATETGNYQLYAKADKSKKIVLNNQEAGSNDTAYGVNENGAFFNLASDLTEEVFLEKDPNATQKFGKVEITVLTRDIENVQRPVQGVEYTLFNGETAVTKGETNQYGKLTLKNIPVPQVSEFDSTAPNGTKLQKVYQLKQTKVPEGFEKNNASNELKFVLTKGSPNTMMPNDFIYNLRFDIVTPALRELAGYNRFGTAVKISKKLYNQTNIEAGKVSAIVIVNGLDFADGLAAGPFAKSFGNISNSIPAPILLVTKNEIPEETMKEIKRLTNDYEKDKYGQNVKKTKVFVIGGKNAISEDVVSKLRALRGVEELNILAGANRYGTAAVVAKTMYGVEQVVLVSGLDFADALAGGTLAIEENAPLLLNHPTEVTPETAEFIARPEIKKVIVIGGKNAISDDAIKGYKATITRVFGADRYETAVEIAKLIVGPSKAYVASGLTFADALALTPYVRMTGADGIILLTGQNEVPMSVRKYLNTNKGTFAPYGTNTFIVGGENAVSAEVERVLKEEVFK